MLYAAFLSLEVIKSLNKPKKHFVQLRSFLTTADLADPAGPGRLMNVLIFTVLGLHYTLYGEEGESEGGKGKFLLSDVPG